MTVIAEVRRQEPQMEGQQAVYVLEAKDDEGRKFIQSLHTELSNWRVRLNADGSSLIIPM